MLRIRSLLRLTAPALAAFAWRNRDELFEWANFGLRAVQSALPGGSDLEDVKTEGRLRYALGMDRRTRRADGLHVEVFDGIRVCCTASCLRTCSTSRRDIAGRSHRCPHGRQPARRDRAAAGGRGNRETSAPRVDARAAVDDEHLAGQPRRRVGEQEERAPTRCRRARRGGRAGAPAPSPSSFGSHSARAMSVFTSAGCDRVDAHGRRELLRELARQVDERGLRHVVRADERAGPHAADRHDVQHRRRRAPASTRATRRARSAAGR